MLSLQGRPGLTTEGLRCTALPAGSGMHRDKEHHSGDGAHAPDSGSEEADAAFEDLSVSLLVLW